MHCRPRLAVNDPSLSDRAGHAGLLRFVGALQIVSRTSASEFQRKFRELGRQPDYRARAAPVDAGKPLRLVRGSGWPNASHRDCRRGRGDCGLVGGMDPENARQIKFGRVSFRGQTLSGHPLQLSRDARSDRMLGPKEGAPSMFGRRRVSAKPDHSTVQITIT